MPRSLLHYVTDLEGASREILTFTSGMSRESYERSRITQRAVERDFGIIGEAVARIREFYPGCLGHIDDAHKIVSFRNILVHQYSSVDQDDAWSAIVRKIPPFLEQVVALRGKIESGEQL